eukprot:TRINITY_DN9017_c0_g1_i1.p1 TRINITY_DN9017_c0_g1~~TRINITY_DN9017_c0_g1_i1.p1  ORF type:complete len:328 (+),score=29.99 TRINITY_DN9017_c0_g1_i1:777-1760(+)
MENPSNTDFSSYDASPWPLLVRRTPTATQTLPPSPHLPNSYTHRAQVAPQRSQPRAFVTNPCRPRSQHMNVRVQRGPLVAPSPPPASPPRRGMKRSAQWLDDSDEHSDAEHNHNVKVRPPAPYTLTASPQSSASPLPPPLTPSPPSPLPPLWVPPSWVPPLQSPATPRRPAPDAPYALSPTWSTQSSSSTTSSLWRSSQRSPSEVSPPPLPLQLPPLGGLPMPISAVPPLPPSLPSPPSTPSWRSRSPSVSESDSEPGLGTAPTTAPSPKRQRVRLGGHDGTEARVHNDRACPAQQPRFAFRRYLRPVSAGQSAGGYRQYLRRVSPL